MALLSLSYVANTRSSLLTQVNAGLAALTNPTIRGWQYGFRDRGKRIGFEYSINVFYETGGAALATPFVAQIAEDSALADAVSAWQTFVTANPTYFLPSPQAYLADEANKIRKYSLMYIYNTTGGASANWSLR